MGDCSYLNPTGSVIPAQFRLDEVNVGSMYVIEFPAKERVTGCDHSVESDGM